MNHTNEPAGAVCIDLNLLDKLSGCKTALDVLVYICSTSNENGVAFLSSMDVPGLSKNNVNSGKRVLKSHNVFTSERMWRGRLQGTLVTLNPDLVRIDP